MEFSQNTNPTKMKHNADTNTDNITLLTAQYYQQVPPTQLESLLPDGRILLRPDLQATLYGRLFNEENPETWPLPPVSYRARVLKMVLGRLEGAILDPEVDV